MTPKMTMFFTLATSLKYMNAKGGMGALLKAQRFDTYEDAAFWQEVPGREHLKIVVILHVHNTNMNRPRLYRLAHWDFGSDLANLQFNRVQASEG